MEVTPEQWDRLMFQARVQAKFFKERARVYAVRSGPKSRDWMYVVDCPSVCTCRSENGGDER